jgi:glycosyltransferase involved in cell wall biosynthesis
MNLISFDRIRTTLSHPTRPFMIPDDEPSLDLSVIIAARNEIPHLWYTLHSIQQQVAVLNGQCGGVEVLVVDDGSTDGTQKFLQMPAIQQIARAIRTEGVFAPRARHLGAMEARGRWLLFLDAHVLLGPDFLRTVIARFAAEGAPGAEAAGAVHFPVAWNWRGLDDFRDHYELTLDTNFWGQNKRAGFTQLTEIAVSGHAALLVRRDRFFQVGGYAAPFRGYGGEENYLNLKLARFGYRNYSLPDVYFLHCSQRLSDPWTTPALFRNDVLTAYIIGGERWARPLRENHWLPAGTTPEERDQLYEEALRDGEEERALLDRTAPLTLEEVLEGLRARGAAF